MCSEIKEKEKTLTVPASISGEALATKYTIKFVQNQQNVQIHWMNDASLSTSSNFNKLQLPNRFLKAKSLNLQLVECKAI